MQHASISKLDTHKQYSTPLYCTYTHPEQQFLHLQKSHSCLELQARYVPPPSSLPHSKIQSSYGVDADLISSVKRASGVCPVSTYGPIKTFLPPLSVEEASSFRSPFASSCQSRQQGWEDLQHAVFHKVYHPKKNNHISSSPLSPIISLPPGAQPAFSGDHVLGTGIIILW